MQRLVPALLVACAAAIAGCSGGTPVGSPTESPGPADDPPATTEPPPDERTVSVTYAIHVGELPDEFRSLTVGFEVVFVADQEGLGPCYRETYYGEHEPTPTPMAPPGEDECYRYGQGGEGEGVTLDLTRIDGSRSIGPFSAPGSVDGGHALLVMEAEATLENGSRTTSFRDTSFPALQVANGGLAERNRPYQVVDGGFGRQYNVTIGVVRAREDFEDEFRYEFEIESGQ